MTERQKLLINYIETEIVWNLQHPGEERVNMEDLQHDLKLAKEEKTSGRTLTLLFWEYGVPMTAEQNTNKDES